MARTIVVVDDSHTRSKLVQTCLEKQGYHAFVCSYPGTGWEQLTSKKPELLVFGIALPEAYDLLRQMRKEPLLAHLPVIVLLKSWASEGDIFRGWELGVDAFLLVQFNCFELNAYVKRILLSVDEDHSPSEN